MVDMFRKHIVILGALVLALALGVPLIFAPTSGPASAQATLARPGGQLPPVQGASTPLSVSSSLEGFPAPASGPGPAQGPDSHFIGRGDFFELYWQFGNIAGTLYVTRGGNPQKPETWLYYLIKQGAATVQSGYGNIPSGDLTGSNLTGLLLKTDTTAAANPGFNRAVGNGGAIDVKVQKILGIPGPSFQQFGNTERVFYNSILRINGQSAYSPGSAQGKAMDSPIGPGSWAIIGMNLHAPIKVQQAP